MECGLDGAATLGAGRAFGFPCHRLGVRDLDPFVDRGPEVVIVGPLLVLDIDHDSRLYPRHRTRSDDFVDEGGRVPLQLVQGLAESMEGTLVVDG